MKARKAGTPLRGFSKGGSREYRVSAGGREAWNPPHRYAHLYRAAHIFGNGCRGREPHWAFAKVRCAGAQVTWAPERVFRGDCGGHLLLIYLLCLWRMTTGLRCGNRFVFSGADANQVCSAEWGVNVRPLRRGARIGLLCPPEGSFSRPARPC